MICNRTSITTPFYSITSSFVSGLSITVIILITHSLCTDNCSFFVTFFLNTSSSLNKLIVAVLLLREQAHTPWPGFKLLNIYSEQQWHFRFTARLGINQHSLALIEIEASNFEKSNVFTVKRTFLSASYFLLQLPENVFEILLS